MPIENTADTHTEGSSESQAPQKGTGLIKNILAAFVILDVIGIWIIALKIILQTKNDFLAPKLFFVLVAAGLSLIGLGIANWLAPRLPAISATKILKYALGILLAVYVLYPTYENFRGDDDISLATVGTTGAKTIADLKAIAPRITVLQQGPGTFRVEVTQKDARLLAAKRFSMHLIQNPEQRARVRKLDKLPVGSPNAMIGHMIHAVSADSLFKTVRRLERFGTRVDRSLQCDSAAELLAGQFKQYGLEVESQIFGRPEQAYLEVQAVADNTLFVSSSDAELFCSTDGGESWTFRALCPESLVKLAFINARQGYALSWANNLFATSDGGRTWRKLQPDQFRGYSDVRCLSERVALVAGSGGRLLRTEDGGNSWKRMEVSTDRNLHGIDSPDGRILWVVGDGGVLLHSMDAGRSWRRVNSGVSTSLMRVQFRDRVRGVVLGDSALVLHTSDGGRSWKKAGTELRDVQPGEMLFTSEFHGWLTEARYRGIVLETQDGGCHWVEAEGLLRTARKISGRTNKTMIGCGSGGTLFLSKNGGTTWQLVTSKLLNSGGVASRNICATLKGIGEPESEIILVGHYDSAHKNAPGANDNASGTAAIMEAARICSKYKFDRTIRFLAAGAEEEGLVGSGYYAREARKSGRKICAVINADMIGYPVLGDSRRIAMSTGRDWTPLMDSTLIFNRRYSLGLILDAHTALMGGSDHESFIRAGYAAIDLSEGTAMEIWGGFDPFYHRPSDTSDKLDGNLLRNAAQLMIMIAAETARPVALSGN